jgi:Ca-activated chloride channel family protein
MQDGTYTVRLILRDKLGHTYRESKTFVIASKPPVVQVKLDRKRYQRGERMGLRVSASESTRTLVARMDGTVPVALRWDAKSASNTGTLTIPDQAIPGAYKLTVTAEDIAHNISTQEVQIEVLP